MLRVETSKLWKLSCDKFLRILTYSVIRPGNIMQLHPRLRNEAWIPYFDTISLAVDKVNLGAHQVCMKLTFVVEPLTS